MRPLHDQALSVRRAILYYRRSAVADQPNDFEITLRFTGDEAHEMELRVMKTHGPPKILPSEPVFLPINGKEVPVRVTGISQSLSKAEAYSVEIRGTVHDDYREMCKKV